MTNQEDDNGDPGGPKPLIYGEMERFVKRSTCHNNINDLNAVHLA